ncbi:MAG TPA: carbonate dehydratase [Roseiflexaceae bacterium]|nr:carbonate dehydratase [Roseiflexaceae bacterium]
MPEIKQLLANNRQWAARMTENEPDFFQRLAAQQTPGYLWIGCSDSRMPANQLVDLLPGEMFVHRNVANVVVHSDMNCLSVLQYAVEVLQVRHIIVCGHYGCGGVGAALQNSSFGLIDNWLRHVQDVRNKHAELLRACRDDTQRFERLCELNVIEQVVNVCQTSTLQSAWQRGQRIKVHGWVYSLADGLLRDLGITVADAEELAQCYKQALERIGNSEETIPAAGA